MDSIKIWDSSDDNIWDIDIKNFDKDFDKNVVPKLEKIDNPNTILTFMGLTKLPNRLPKKINGVFSCSNNKLTSLDGCPEYVEGTFRCDGNYLTSLNSCPKYVGGDFECYNNKLISLKGCPKRVNGRFNCENNNLKTLEGSPEYVKKTFYCDINKLVSLDGCPKYIGGNFCCRGNRDLSKDSIIEGLKDITIKGIIYTDYGEFDSYEELVKNI